MSKLEEVKQIIRKAVENASSWPTVFGPVQGVEPANQFCMVTMKTIQKEEHDVITYTGSYTEPLTEHQRQECIISFEIQARGKGAMSTLDKVIGYFDSEMRDVDMWPYIGSGGHDDIQSISTGYMGKILEVAVVTIDIHTTLPKENAHEWMNIVDINIKRSDNTEITKITIPEEK